MALIVKIFINNTQIIERHCVRVQGEPHEWCEYEADDGRRIRHHYDHGAEALAKKLLNRIIPWAKPSAAAPPSR